MNFTPNDLDSQKLLLRIIQPQSDELNSKSRYYNPSIKTGDIYQRFTGVIFRENTKAVICGLRKYYAEWTSRNNGKLVGKYSEDSEVVINTLKNYPQNTLTDLRMQTGNLLVKTYGVLLIIKNDKFYIPAELTLSRSYFIAGERLRSLISAYQLPETMLFNLTTVQTENDKGIWFRPEFSYAGVETDSRVLKLVDELRPKIDEILFETPKLNENKINEKFKSLTVYSENDDSLNNILFNVLKTYRYKTAEAENKKCFQIFSNATLNELCEKRPITIEDLSLIIGLNKSSIIKYGEDIIQIISTILRDNNAYSPLEKLKMDLKSVITECVQNFNYKYGKRGIIRILSGSKTLQKTEAQLKYNKPAISSTFWGLLENLKRKTILILINELIEEGILFQVRRTGNYPVLYVKQFST